MRKNIEQREYVESTEVVKFELKYYKVKLSRLTALYYILLKEINLKREYI